MLQTWCSVQTAELARTELAQEQETLGLGAAERRLTRPAEKSHLLRGGTARGTCASPELPEHFSEQREHRARSTGVQGTRGSYSPFTPVR